MSLDQKARGVSSIVSDAGGSVVGRTRLQKIGYLLSAAGLEQEFSFVYKHYGPYSEELAQSAKAAQFLGYLDEQEHPTSWGGTYSSYRALGQQDQPANQARAQLARLAAEADAVELELAATAVFLANEQFADPWGETARRKPEKAADGRIERAKRLYLKIREVETPVPFPTI